MSRGARFPLIFVGSVLVIVLVVVLASAIDTGDGDEDDRPVATAPANVREAPPSPTPTTSTDVAGQRSTSDQANLAAGDTPLLPLPSGGLSRFDGEEVAGTRLVVVDVSGDAFSVALSGDAADRVEVLAGGSYAPKVDDRVNLRGVVDGDRVRADSVVPEGSGSGAGGDADSNAGEEDRP